MTTVQQTKTCNTAACSSYGLKGVDFSTKTMKEIMDAAAGQEWAKNILTADRASHQNLFYLSRNNGNQNLYGIMSIGIQPYEHSFTSSDGTVKAAVQGWLKKLTEDFKGVKTYTPTELAQRIADLEHAGECIRTNTQHLFDTGELTKNDYDYLTRIGDGLNFYAEAAKKLLAAVKAGPCIGSVELNIPTKNH